MTFRQVRDRVAARRVRRRGTGGVRRGRAIPWRAGAPWDPVACRRAV